MNKVRENKKYAVYLYGAGAEYNRFMEIFGLYSDKIRVEAVVTTKALPFAYIDGFPCITIEETKFDSVDYIIVAVENAWHEVYKTLTGYGVCRNKIIRSRSFFVPNFDFDEYIELLHSDVTIISNYCLGGIVYADLGLRCLSPTKNMFCRSEHYLEFVSNLEYYLSLDMEECTSPEIDYEREFVSYAPRGIIDQHIIWHFNHDTSSKEGIERWNRTKKRVNLDNVAILMECHSEEDAYKFSKLNWEKKLGIYYKPLDLPDMVCCPLWNEPAVQIRYTWSWPTFANRFFTNKDGYVSPVNWIRFLNGKDGYLRYRL